MNREDFYFKQKVTEAELDTAFDYVESALYSLMTDQALIGIFQGGTASQHAGTPNLTVDLTGPCYGRDNNGQRCFFLTPQNPDISQDSLGASTAVTSGNERWVSVSLKFKRVLSDPRTDGNGATIQFLRTESFELVVTQGAQAPTGTSVRPTKDPNALLLCDVIRTFGQTQIFNADISITRRDDTFSLSGSPLTIRTGTPIAAVQAMLDLLNSHVANIANPHAASSISYGGFTDPNGFSTVGGGGSVEAGIDAALLKIAYLHDHTLSANTAIRVRTTIGNKWEADGSEIWVRNDLGALYSFMQNNVVTPPTTRFEITDALPPGVVLTEVRLSLEGNGNTAGGADHSALPANKPTIQLVQLDPDTQVATNVSSVITDASATQPTYDAQHFIAITGLSHVVDRTKRYFVVVAGESGANAIANRLTLHAFDLSWSPPP
jgi:hypothetical protein